MPTGSSDDHDPESPQYIWSSSKGIFRKNKHWNSGKSANVPALPAPGPQKALSAPDLKALPAPEPRSPTPVSSDTEDREEMTEDQKRLERTGKKKATKASRYPVPEAKASKPVKGQESPETKVSNPMVTRRQASRAGGLRPGGGLGSTDTCVDLFNPSKT
jgi:hypothetical protein